MNSRSAARGFLAFLLSLPALQGEVGYAVGCTSKTVCALKESTVDIICTYNFPKKDKELNVTQLWHKGKKHKAVSLTKDADYEGRVEYSCGEISCIENSCNGTCALKIKNLTQSDSAEYMFSFIINRKSGKFSGDPGVKLSVTDQVMVSFASSTDPTRANMTCHSMCSPTGGFKYNWFRNGQCVEQGIYYKGNISSKDNYSCAVEGYKRLHSPLVYVPKTPSVTVSPSGEIVNGSSVTLSCSSDANPAADYTWFKEHEDSVGRSGQNYTITNITSELGGNYCCQAHNAIGRHNSTCFYIHVTETSSLTSFIVRIVVVSILVLATILLVFLFHRTTRASREASGLGEAAEMVGEVEGEVRDRNADF